MAEVAVVRDERYVVIDAGLGDEAVGEFGFQLSRSEGGAKQTGAPPETISDLEQRQSKNDTTRVIGELGPAQSFRENDRRKIGGSRSNRFIDDGCIAIEDAVEQS
ncbi:MAG TPA: hypothetical protein VN181_00895 [Thermoanaerobaculia bacterium]|nr:hypothetical protein [Thermoanaerobaculia bacterium]